MEVTVQISHEIANRFTASRADLIRRTRESFALEEFREGRITKVELRKMLGLERIELDGFFKSHGVYEEYTVEDFDRERQALQELGF